MLVIDTFVHMHKSRNTFAVCVGVEGEIVQEISIVTCDCVGLATTGRRSSRLVCIFMLSAVCLEVVSMYVIK